MSGYANQPLYLLVGYDKLPIYVCTRWVSERGRRFIGANIADDVHRQDGTEGWWIPSPLSSVTDFEPPALCDVFEQSKSLPIEFIRITGL